MFPATGGSTQAERPKPWLKAAPPVPGNSRLFTVPVSPQGPPGAQTESQSATLDVQVAPDWQKKPPGEDSRVLVKSPFWTRFAAGATAGVASQNSAAAASTAALDNLSKCIGHSPWSWIDDVDQEQPQCRRLLTEARSAFEKRVGSIR